MTDTTKSEDVQAIETAIGWVESTLTEQLTELAVAVEANLAALRQGKVDGTNYEVLPLGALTVRIDQQIELRRVLVRNLMQAEQAEEAG